MSRVVLWKDIPEHERADDRPCPIWGTQVQNRGCTAAVRWPDGRGYHRCATHALKEHELCLRHAERAGAIPPVARHHQYPRGLDNRIGNCIRHNLRRLKTFHQITLTVAEFRRLSDVEIMGWRNAGRLSLPVIKAVRDTWPDADLIRAFELRADAWDAYGAVATCNWVGEGVPA